MWQLDVEEKFLAQIHNLCTCFVLFFSLFLNRMQSSTQLDVFNRPITNMKTTWQEIHKVLQPPASRQHQHIKVHLFRLQLRLNFKAALHFYVYNSQKAALRWALITCHKKDENQCFVPAASKKTPNMSVIISSLSKLHASLLGRYRLYIKENKK